MLYKTWEYKIINLSREHWKAEELLNSLAKDDWEIVSVIVTNVPQEIIAYLKRQSARL